MLVKQCRAGSESIRRNVFQDRPDNRALRKGDPSDLRGSLSGSSLQQAISAQAAEHTKAGPSAQDPHPFTFQELGALGYKFIFITLYASHAATYAVWNAMEELVRDEEQAQWRLEKAKVGHPTESHHVMARVAHFQEIRTCAGTRSATSPIPTWRWSSG